MMKKSSSFDHHVQYIEHLNECNDYPAYLEYLRENRSQLFYTLTDSIDVIDGLIGTVVASYWTSLSLRVSVRFQRVDTVVRCCFSFFSLRGWFSSLVQNYWWKEDFQETLLGDERRETLAYWLDEIEMYLKTKGTIEEIHSLGTSDEKKAGNMGMTNIRRFLEVKEKETIHLSSLWPAGTRTNWTGMTIARAQRDSQMTEMVLEVMCETTRLHWWEYSQRERWMDGIPPWYLSLHFLPRELFPHTKMSSTMMLLFLVILSLSTVGYGRWTSSFSLRLDGTTSRSDWTIIRNKFDLISF